MFQDYHRELTSDDIVTAVGYIRVSSRDQVEGWSLDGQVREIKAFCQARDLTLVRIYRDEGFSAFGKKADTRPGFNQMLKDAAQGQFHVVVSVSLDRLSRNFFVTIETQRLFQQWGVSFISIKERDFDASDSFGKIHLALMASFAEQYSESISVHTRRGQRQRRESGREIGVPPYGYQV